jgi:hypothetical protein
MLFPKQNATSTQRASPPKRGAAEPVNLKTHRNPAKTAQRPFGLARRRAHFFARISCVFKECASHRLGKWFSSFCRNKRTKKSHGCNNLKLFDFNGLETGRLRRLSSKIADRGEFSDLYASKHPPPALSDGETTV